MLDGLDLDFAGSRELVASVVAVVVLWLGRRLLLRLSRRRLQDTATLYRWRKLSSYVTTLLTLLVLVAIWFDAFRSVSTFLGLLAAGLAVALREPIVNLAAWMFIVWRRPFEVGDRIEIGDVTGDVVDQRIFQFSVMEIGNWVDGDQQTGRIVHISNALVFSQPLANFSQPFPFIWDELPVLVTFESDWEEAKRLLEAITAEHGQTVSAAAEGTIVRAAERLLLPTTDLAPSVLTSVEDSGVLLTMRFLTEPRRRRARRQAIWEDVLRAFAQRPEIDFAYPTRRFFSNWVEGASGAPAEGAERAGRPGERP